MLRLNRALWGNFSHYFSNLLCQQIVERIVFEQKYHSIVINARNIVSHIAK